MRTSKFFALVGFCFLFNIAQPTVSASPFQQYLLEHPNYVVIGAFAMHRNAIRFTDHAHRDLNLNARFEINPDRNLYYVYVLSTDNREAAVSEARRLRSKSELRDTWVYNGILGRGDMREKRTVSSGTDIDPDTGTTIEQVAPEDGIKQDNTVIKGIPPQPVVQKEEPDSGVEGKRFFFSIYRALDNDTLQGDVDVIDPERSKKLGTYKGNMPVKVSPPSSSSKNISLVCEVFGYRKVQRDINYDQPVGDGIAPGENNSIVVPFELVRLQKGDIAVMYNVYFFKDAGIMRPESRYEVNSLLEMLQENKNYKIRIHGHTNGNASGKIISMGDGSDSFFSLGNTRQGFGSAKKLSEERATVIRDYLVANGVDASRMQIKSWGGKRPIYDKHSTRAQENVRVEIEILED